MNPLDSDLADLIAAETEAVQPPSGAKSRHWAAVSAAVGPVLPGTEALPAAPAAAAAAKSTAILKLVGGTVVAGALAVGTWSATRPPAAPSTAAVTQAPPTGPEDAKRPPAQPSPRPDPGLDGGRPQEAPPAELKVNAESEALPQPQEPPPAASPRATRSPPPPKAAPEQAKPRGLAEELALIESMRKAVEARDDKTALDVAKRHRREFPKGSLIPDRLDLEARAACRSGRTKRGRDLIADLERRWPRAPVSEPTRRACTTTQDPEPQ